MLDLDATTKIALYASLWGVILLLELTRLSRPRFGTVGLPFVLLMGFTMMHCAALVHLVPGYDHTHDVYLASMNYSRETVADGLEASFLAMLAAFLGFLLADRNAAPFAPQQEVADAQALAVVRRRSLQFLVVGASGLLIQTGTTMMGLTLPGFQAVLFGARSLVAVGAIGLIYHTYRSVGSRRALVLALIFSASVPTLFLITTAILEDSLVLAIAIFVFYLTLSRGTGAFSPIVRNITLMAAAITFAVVFAAGYMQTRDVLRETLRYGGDVETALKTTQDLAESFDSSTVFDNSTLALLDGRLNQNVFVGLAIEYLRIFPNLQADGETLLLALAGGVPRFLWPDKPERGGSAFMAKYTGLTFHEEATFGVGLILEFYVNFLYFGVFFGFLLLGYVMRRIDIVAARAMSLNDIVALTPFYLIGIAIIQPLSDLFFIVTGIFAALLVGWAVTVVARLFPVRVALPRRYDPPTHAFAAASAPGHQPQP
ncbi:hypothetical protein JDN40_16000 [Rhodomicrobium vannielii ATCC 17100]|uniref:hypothetical protein n=1 Tax=Rhodomicrobium vannielii TaxID=1069 RepID=UPI00191A9E73|nr:hypothetical protein [Rhodomicrobium vannielii]MBJ7535611.1 hypothetical protein [Rhodomicrobium vannielii ATCC 17100]